MALVPCLMALWAAGIEPAMLRIRTETLTSPFWPAAQPALRIAFVADLHVGAPHVPLRRVDEIVAAVNAAQPDLILLGGDFVPHVLGGAKVEVKALARSLGKLRARYGVYAVLGNHDHWDGDAPALSAAFAEMGVTVIDNASRRLAVEGGHVWLVGIGDSTTRNARPEAAFRGVPFAMPMLEPVIVLAHDPSVFARVPREVALIAAGHTHGGQVRIPFIGAVFNASLAPLRHSLGVILEHGKLMYVTAGIGTSVLPIRFNCPPEFAILTIGAEPLKR